ncbi:transcriptional regulator, LuxR family [Hoylesella saccharolytica F0055]|uniref:Transcriptional regulator, LuxR family n=1 Tax=Hoylesella saccharolytica F0055 TaxID=1127699 RepID=L1NHP9_9BACT|nr:response regulator transcription factor [Hoylesella saccharolytica]EKY02836.1 transcriptional regulator, LuxR family [Hoylesella saccharolytica F0055]
MERPKIAIIDLNTLAALGLRQILQNILPIIKVEIFGSFTELEANHPDDFVHYFVATSIVLQNRNFFLERKHKTIVLTTSSTPNGGMTQFNTLCINMPEPQLVRSLLQLEQYAHAHGRHLPPMPSVLQAKILSDREIEVLALICQGFINKEIAHKLNIGLSTVITHRKNIMDKLGVKSVSGLTIYAIMHGYVDINKI